MTTGGRELTLEVGPYRYHAGRDPVTGTLFVLGFADTSVGNLTAVRSLTLNWRWPFVRYVDTVIDFTRPEEEN